MSSPSETRSQGSFQSSSQYATGGALQDTAESVQQGAIVPGSSVTESRRAPNSAFSLKEDGNPSTFCITGTVKVAISVRRIGCKKKSATGGTCRGERDIRSRAGRG